MTAEPAPPCPMTLAALQRYVRDIVAARGFTAERNEIFILLVEEVGELASEFKNRTFYPERYDRRNLAYEMVDILLYLIDLANGFGIDLAAVWAEHERESDIRFAGRRDTEGPLAQIDPDGSLNDLVKHLVLKRRERNFEDSPEILMILLTEEVGEIAKEIRKFWKGMGESERLGREIIDAMTYLLRMGGWFEVDMEEALRAKEQENSRRSWAY